MTLEQLASRIEEEGAGAAALDYITDDELTELILDPTTPATFIIHLKKMRIYLRPTIGFIEAANALAGSMEALEEAKRNEAFEDMNPTD